MIVIKETSLEDFDFWSYAREKVRILNPADFRIVESYLVEEYPDGVPEGEVNDLFMHNFDYVAALLGYDTWDEFEDARKAQWEAA